MPVVADILCTELYQRVISHQIVTWTVSPPARWVTPTLWFESGTPIDREFKPLFPRSFIGHFKPTAFYFFNEFGSRSRE